MKDKFYVGQRVSRANTLGCDPSSPSRLRIGSRGTVRKARLVYAIRGLDPKAWYWVEFDDLKSMHPSQCFSMLEEALEPIRDDESDFSAFMERITNLPEKVT